MPARKPQLGQFAPGARIVVRDAEWVIRRVDHSSDGELQLVCDGISELVRNQEGVFLTGRDKKIDVLEANRTGLVQDDSPGFVQSRLFMESQLRRAVPSDERIRVGHKAAMRQVPYQLVPAAQSLQQVRQRILIADAVGLGKTLEAGILVSELIARGRGRRILVLAVKSMLTQFQKEFWNRFTIPLTRLDSEGLRRVRNRIPTNHNPFHYYDRAIISIDTLKREREYKSYLESAHWDIIVIDEAHNVADRGTGSLRSKLAKLLAKCSDTLIMLSATPHDGRARSFASLVNMLDPTAITDPDDYGKQDFRDKGLVIRRFKKDIRDQVTEAFRDRETHSLTVQAGALEEAAYDALLAVTVAGKRSRQGMRDLFVVGLEKALFSSPAACAESVDKRIRNRQRELSRQVDDSVRRDIEAEIDSLTELRRAVAEIDRTADSRYQRLLKAIRKGQPFRWRGTDPNDRLVIFTERIATMNWLAEGLQQDLGLKSGQIAMLHGGMSDMDQQKVVEGFGNEDSKVRLLVCSDVAAEGINLHYRCHRLIHYDMPWSLMVFQQRNGRIDRYGQDQTPEIVYLVSESSNDTIRGDQRILEVLREKDAQAYQNIGDPSAFSRVHSIEAEEEVTKDAIAAGKDAEAFDRQLCPEDSEGDELMALFLGTPSGENGDSPPSGETSANYPAAPPQPTVQLSMFPDDLAYGEAALHYLRRDNQKLEFEVDRQTRSLSLDAPNDLEHRFGYLPSEIWPDQGRFDLTADTEAVEAAVIESRKSESTWPRKQYLWRQHPVIEWLNDRMLATFGRHQAPVLAGIPGLEDGETAYAFAGTALNRKSHPLVSVWGAALFRNGSFSQCVSLDSLLERTALRSGGVPNGGFEPDIRVLRNLLPEAVEWAEIWVQEKRDACNNENDRKLQAALERLEALKKRQLQHVRQTVARQQSWEAVKRSQIKKRSDGIEEVFTEYLHWVEDSMTLDGKPWIQVLCVMTGEK